MWIELVNSSNYYCVCIKLKTMAVSIIYMHACDLHALSGSNIINHSNLILRLFLEGLDSVNYVHIICTCQLSAAWPLTEGH